jgi:hypothetical protein
MIAQHEETIRPKIAQPVTCARAVSMILVAWSSNLSALAIDTNEAP